MDERSLNILAALIYLFASVTLVRLLGTSLARKRFTIRDMLYATTVVAVTAAAIAAAGWVKFAD